MNISIEEMPREIDRLLEENERLKEELKYTIPIVEHNQTIQSNINSYNKLAEYSKELEDRIDELNNLNEKISLALESSEYRIDKAIEVMYDKGTFNLDNEYGKVFVELLDILKGSDKE